MLTNKTVFIDDRPSDNLPPVGLTEDSGKLIEKLQKEMLKDDLVIKTRDKL
jgi:hypothetical protein